MRHGILIRSGGLALGLFAAAAPALARPASYALPCATVAGMVAKTGAVVMDTSPTTFDRYVLDLRYCMPGQQLRPEWIPARDNPQCFVGYTCYDPDRDPRGQM